MSISPGATLRELRERKPLVHQITNYVVMNETANATLALGALPVMAHAREEVEEMVAARVRARAQHRHALGALDRGDAARRPRGERARDPGRARSGRRRRDRVPHRHGAPNPCRGARDSAARQPRRGGDARRCGRRGARRRVDRDRARAGGARGRGRSAARARRLRYRPGRPRVRRPSGRSPWRTAIRCSQP